MAAVRGSEDFAGRIFSAFVEIAEVVTTTSYIVMKADIRLNAGWPHRPDCGELNINNV